MKILALDLSLTATGYALGDNTEVATGVLSAPKSQARGFDRLRWIRGRVLELAKGAELVVLEGYGFAPGRGHAAREMAELGGIVRLALDDAEFSFVDVPPASLKKYATGRGNAPKEEVLAAAIRRLDFQGHDHNAADALWLLTMAADWYDLPCSVKMPSAHRAALDGVRWPTVARVELRAAG